MTRLPFLDHTRFLSRPTPREIAARSKRNGTGSGASGQGELAQGAAQIHRLDNFLEWAITKRGKEDLALSLLAAGCIVGIYIASRYT